MAVRHRAASEAPRRVADYASKPARLVSCVVIVRFKTSVWRFQEAERHFVQAEALYAARGDTNATQSMTVRRRQAMGNSLYALGGFINQNRTEAFTFG